MSRTQKNYVVFAVLEIIVAVVTLSIGIVYGLMHLLSR